MTKEPSTTHFGFRTVESSQKAGMVRQVFDSVAPKYDLMNDLMSMGVHRIWKSIFVDRLAPRPGQRFLDVAGGTGDIAFRILDRVTRRAEVDARTDPLRPPQETPGQVLVLDINHEMIKVGRDRASDRGFVDGLSWMVGDAQAVPLPDRSVDAYTIAFGLRNVTDIDLALREARRVLKPGGRFLCLEFSKVVLPVLDKIYDRYSFSVLPRLGQTIAGDAAAYQYLAESIRQFPAQEALVERMTQAGLRRCDHRNLSGGIAAIHCGWRV
ncbi:MAG: bifunctional demethylmenaquinone methyltransferase/2-methoxy-6-polyprenyl-1,4-benzoquinol methylase UbiE [Rhodospirillaceae bacterium]